MTPEGKIKKLVSAAIAFHNRDVYKFMPVPGGFGPSSLDFILCVRGRFCAVEAKKPGGEPTPRQEFIIATIERAGGVVFVIDGVNGELERFEKWLEEK